MVYLAVYWILGERVLAKSNPWINTVILVLPAALVAWWDLAILPFAEVEIPDAFSLAMGIYIGACFILQWRIKYEGCEVVALPLSLNAYTYIYPAKWRSEPPMARSKSFEPVTFASWKM